jgi:multisubunit Na+/H+ antiporter MnhB subunit
MSILVILLILMLVGAVIALETTNLLSSIVCIGGVGFMMSITYLFLGAPEIAMTQLVVEILCLIILIRATISKDLTAVEGEREFFGLTIAMVAVLAITLVGVRAFTDFPVLGCSVVDRIPDAPSTVTLAAAATPADTPNLVTGILLGSRVYDTLGLGAVLFCAVIGALSILRKTARKSHGEADTESDVA